MPALCNISQLVQCLDTGPQSDIQAISDAALAWDDNTVRWVGKQSDLPREYADHCLDAGRGTVLPGLVDCHTHLAFGGWRADEFVARIEGKSYLDIAREGGGIKRTVRDTAALSDVQLADRCRGFLQQMVELGVTTVECKTGYGLDPEAELRTLRVYREVAGNQPVKLVPTFLAHIVPTEYQSRRAEYVRLLCESVIPRAAAERLARICDVFVEETAFTPEEARAIASAARSCGLPIKLHADQLSDGKGAALAAALGALSADHLEHAADEGIRAMARAGTVAVSLPLASLYLRSAPLDARRLIDNGVRVAVATDFNPGSAPSFHLPLAMLLAVTLQGMTPPEAVKGATVYAAQAISCENECRVGSMEPGRPADFIVIDAPDIEHWIYHFRSNACRATFIDGRQVWGEKLAASIRPART